MAFLAASSFGGSFATKGLLKHNDGLLDYIVDETLKTIEPLTVILYNVAVKSNKLARIVDRIENAHAKVVMPPNKLLLRNRILEAD